MALKSRVWSPWGQGSEGGVLGAIKARRRLRNGREKVVHRRVSLVDPEAKVILGC